VSFRRRDGDVFPGETVRAALRDVDGVVLGYLALIRDVSEERRREDALRQAQKMEAIGQLTGGMAHDFNNLLTVIKGNLEMAALEAEGDVLEMIEEAHSAADMGASLTGRMLAFARRQPLKPQAVDVNALIVSLSDLLRRTLGERVRLSTALTPRIPPVLVDPAQLQNAILNLALNARDAMPNGGALAIETAVLGAPGDAVFAKQPTSSGDFVALTVSDTGKGIAPHIRDRLFEPYTTTKAAGKGGGFGLAMVYGFITQSGGHVAVESELGRGASFTLYLPQAEAPPVAAAAFDERGAVAGGGETILLVEDSSAVRRLTRRRLESLGYCVLEATNAQEALGLIDNGSTFDLLFTDVVMPGDLDGPGLAAAVRAKRSDARVLFTSGYVDPSVFEQAAVATGADLLTKPYSLAELARKVLHALRP
jgi:signal transduction histidine kinase